MFNQVTIIGVGLIGGSIGLGLRARGLARTVTGVGRDPSRLQEALERGAVDRFTTDPQTGLAGAELVVIAVPVGSIIPVLRSVVPHLRPGTIVTDVGSCKAAVVAAAEEVTPTGVHFVGGHPMAGSERAGIGGADRYLFEGAYYVLTPTPNTERRALDRVRAMAEGLGCRVIEMEPQEHDRAVAAVSHLPHLLACTLVNTVAGMEGSERALALAAGGYRDTTRVAAGNPGMWLDIFLANRRMLKALVDRFRSELNAIEGALEDGEPERITAWLDAARRSREGLPARMKGYLKDLHEITITISDRPGTIAAVASILGRHEINISDLEILRVREGEGGTVRLAFGTEHDRDRAAELLAREGIPVTRR
ncbi:MAG: prephenate dehydrogenase [Bacillota bacterium]